MGTRQSTTSCPESQYTLMIIMDTVIKAKTSPLCNCPKCMRSVYSPSKPPSLTCDISSHRYSEGMCFHLPTPSLTTCSQNTTDSSGENVAIYDVVFPYPALQLELLISRVHLIYAQAMSCIQASSSTSRLEDKTALVLLITISNHSFTSLSFRVSALLTSAASGIFGLSYLQSFFKPYSSSSPCTRHSLFSRPSAKSPLLSKLLLWLSLVDRHRTTRSLLPP